MAVVHLSPELGVAVDVQPGVDGFRSQKQQKNQHEHMLARVQMQRGWAGKRARETGQPNIDEQNLMDLNECQQ